jgi:hypothetical protein
MSVFLMKKTLKKTLLKLTCYTSWIPGLALLARNDALAVHPLSFRRKYLCPQVKM